MEFWALMRVLPTGVFIAGADHSFLMVTYETIASHFDAVSYDAWILTGYNLGYCMALPAVKTDALPVLLHTQRREEVYADL